MQLLLKWQTVAAFEGDLKDDLDERVFTCPMWISTRAFLAAHPLRMMREIVTAGLASLHLAFQTLHASGGWPSIPPERLLRATMLQMLYTIRSKLRTHSAFRQGCMLYELIPNMPDKRLRPLIEKFSEFVN